MSKLVLSGFVLSLFLFLTLSQADSGNSAINKKPDSRGQTGTLQKMIVENGIVTLDLDLNRLNGIKDLKNLLCFRGERVRKIKCLA